MVEAKAAAARVVAVATRAEAVVDPDKVVVGQVQLDDPRAGGEPMPRQRLSDNS